MADPRVPGHTIQQWAHDLLVLLGKPTSEANITAFVNWANHESGGYNPNVAGGKFNPLNTTEGAVGYAGNGGSQGNIKDFSSYDQGLRAQAYNLTHTKGAGYEGILSALDKSDTNAMYAAVNASKFGTHNLGAGQAGTNFGTGAASGGGTSSASGLAPVGAAPAAAKFNLPPGGRLYAVDGTFVVIYKVGADNVYYDFSTPGVGARVNTSGTPSGAAITHDQFYGLPNLVHAGVVDELAGKDIQGAKSYQDWLTNQLQLLSGGNKAMLADPAVVSLFIQGAAHKWSPEEVQAKLKLTTYWKTHDDAQRNWQTLSPAEQQSRTNDQASQLQASYFSETGQQIDPHDKNLLAWAAKIAGGGATITEATWQWIRPIAAKDAQSPWSRQLEQEKEAQLQQGVDVSNMGSTVQQILHDYGIKPSDQTVAKWSKDIVTKVKSQEDLTKLATSQASILYPWAKDDLQTGMTVKDIAQPWTDTYNRVMEQNTDLFNPKVQQALVQGQPVYDFEKNLKLSDDWLNTGNARSTLSQAGAEVGKAMGFA